GHEISISGIQRATWVAPWRARKTCLHSLQVRTSSQKLHFMFGGDSLTRRRSSSANIAVFVGGGDQFCREFRNRQVENLPPRSRGQFGNRQVENLPPRS